ncbi:hypothetical protein [Thalassotalea aquiviva]|uniref:hypothetical protein n=1 Tax=Thalassotalea aquiviva TaxID=3242415 RepID=UPI00352BC468
MTYFKLNKPFNKRPDKPKLAELAQIVKTYAQKAQPLKRLIMVLSLSTLGLSFSSYASLNPSGQDTMAHLDADFKVAVIRSAVTADEIEQGHYQKVVQKIFSSLDHTSDANDQISLCAVWLKQGEYEKADAACTNAINLLDAMDQSQARLDYVKSIAYSNRAIVRFYLSQRQAAFSDVNSALLFDQNTVVMANLRALNLAVLKQEMSLSVNLGAD